MGTQITRDFHDFEDVLRTHPAEVYDYKTPYWRVRYADDDWELRRRELERSRARRQADSIKDQTRSAPKLFVDNALMTAPHLACSEPYGCSPLAPRPLDGANQSTDSVHESPPTWEPGRFDLEDPDSDMLDVRDELAVTGPRECLPAEMSLYAESVNCMS